MPDIPGNSTTTSSVSVGSTVTSSIETVSDHDWFRIELVAGQSITVTLNGTGATPLGDPYLRIRNAAGALIAENDDGGPGLNSLVSFTATTTGTYYIDVSEYSTGTGDYSLQVRPFTPPPVGSVAQLANQLTHGYWDGASHHFSVTQGGSLTVNLTGLTSDGVNLARLALQQWSDVIGVRFVEVSSGGQIMFDDNETGAFSSSIFSNGISTSARVNVSTQWLVNSGTTLNSYGYQTYLHEIGHALGLGHGGNYNSSADYPGDATFLNDSWPMSVMSYFSQNENSYFSNQGFTQSYLGTPMIADIAAMSVLYGLSTTTRTGATTYGFNSNAGDVYNASLYPTIAYTVFDSGGIDTLDYSGFSQNQRIDLTPGQFSNIGGRTGNVIIALGTQIENAIGGSGNDTLIGNGAANVLQGGLGNDVLLGGAGADILIGGSGSDLYEVDDLGDVVVESPGQAAADVVFAYVNFALPRGVEHLVLSYGNQTYGYGNELDNIIIGNAQGNVLEGGGGYDTITGGPGSDLFIVNPNFGVDVITDFVAGQGTEDAIYFSRQLFGSFQQVLNNAAQVGLDTWIGDGLGNTVVLQNVALSSLHPDDFGFI